MRSDNDLLSPDDRKSRGNSPTWQVMAVEFVIVFGSALFSNFLFKTRESFIDAFFIALWTVVITYWLIWARE
jgi:hypothetical protein